jgi:8-oxo-dGTP pyrophosphatase MutT (NUDIX family)
LKTKFGFPVATSRKEVFDILTLRRIVPLKKIEGPLDYAEYLKRPLSTKEKEQLKYAPKLDVVVLEDPSGEPFVGFRQSWKNAAVVFCLLPGDLVVVSAEYRHGIERVCLLTPGGILDEGENPRKTATREFREETGILLKKVIHIGPKEGVPVSGRQSTQMVHLFLGIPKMPITVQATKLDKNERAQTLLIPLSAWIKIIELEARIEWVASLATFFGLTWLGRLHVE